MINIFIKALIDKNSKYRFIKKLPPKSTLLDVGCGNHSPSKAYYLNNKIIVDGIDILEYNMNNQDKKILRNYFLVPPDNFNEFIRSITENYNAIVCSHVLEHVTNFEELLEILINKLKKDGLLYISFPNIRSLKFPCRKGTLNFFDDETHSLLPPNIETVKDIIKRNNCTLINIAVPNKPLLGYILGFLLEPVSIMLKRVLPFTWYYWGFENVLIIKK